MSKIMQVFYGDDLLPYKDKERQVHYPIVGSAFQGASNTTEIRFYIDKIGNGADTWVANSKLPNGKMGNKILTTHYDEELEESYALLQLSSFYTQAKGDLYISLNGFSGGVEVIYDSETEQYQLNGIPTIQATGSIKLSINYATPLIAGDEQETITLQSLMALIGTKLNIWGAQTPNYIKLIYSEDIENYDFSQNWVYGDYILNTYNNSFYKLDVHKHPQLIHPNTEYELQTNKVQEINSSSTDIEYPSAKCVWDITQNVREVAEGKCRSYVIDVNTVALTEAYFTNGGVVYKANGKKITTWQDFINYVNPEGLTYSNILNNRFNSNDNSVSIGFKQLAFSNNYLLTDDNIVLIGTEDEFKIGDIILVKQLNVPDRWVAFINVELGSSITFYSLETTKVDLTNYVTTNTDQTITSAKTIQFSSYNTTYLKFKKTGDTYYGSIGLKEINGDKVLQVGYYSPWNFGIFKIFPNSNNVVSIGDSDHKISDIYINGLLKDGDDTHDIAIANIEDKQNKVTTINSQSTNAQYPSAKCVYDNLTDIREVAEGKCKSYVLSYSDTVAIVKQDLNTYQLYKAYKLNSDGSLTDITNNVKNGDYDSGYNLCNSRFNSQNASINLKGTTSYQIKDLYIFKGTVGQYYFVEIGYTENIYAHFNTGDIFYVIETDVPDRWFDGTQYGYVLETTKVDLTNYYTKNASIIPSATNTFDLGSSSYTFKDAYFGGIVYANDIRGKSYSNYGFIIDNGAIYTIGGFNPLTTATYDLGNSSYQWKDLYLSGYIYVGSGALYYSSGFVMNTGLRPSSNDAYDLGHTTAKWKNLYLSGKLYGNTKNIEIDDIYSFLYSSGYNANTIIYLGVMNVCSKSADTTFTLEQAPSNTYPEYKALITNSHSTDAIALTFTGVSNILCNDDNCVIAGNTITIPSGTTIEISILNGNMCAINWAV